MHVRHFQIAGMTLQVESDLPLTDTTFSPPLQAFCIDEPGSDVVVLRHHSGLPDSVAALTSSEGAELVYRAPPWAIYRVDSRWIYVAIGDGRSSASLGLTAVFAADHSRGDIYSTGAYSQARARGGLSSLTLFTTDQIVLAPLLAERQGCLLHSAGLSVDGQGLLFVGHSEAGKSTTMRLVLEELGERAVVLCDDRNAVRLWPQGFEGGPAGFYVHGTWSHGDVPLVSPASAPLRAILFLEQAAVNELMALDDQKQRLYRLLATLIKPLETADWWEKELDVLQHVVASVPCHVMRFDKSGAIVDLLKQLVR